MLARQPIIINGQPVGRLKASWILFKESWSFLRSDSEMMWIPVVTALLNLVLFSILFATFFFLGGVSVFSGEEMNQGTFFWGCIFGGYVIGAFTLALAQAAIANTVYIRVKGGDATLGQSLKAAFSHWLPLLMWSAITSTVGLILRIISERSELVGKIIAALVGGAWSVLTYFVVPAMIIDKKSPFSSIKKSAHVFKATWGETVLTGISLTLAFLLVHTLVLLAVLAIGFVIYTLALPTLNYIVLGILYIIWIVLSVLVVSVLESVLRTLLYVYATEGIIPSHFNPELFGKILMKTNSQDMPPAATTTPSFVQK